MRFFTIFLSAATLLALSCSKEAATNTNPPLPGAKVSSSFVEEFDTVGNLTARGWVFKNNSYPVGQSGWRQGRYEASTGQYPFLPNSTYGFQAYSAHNTPIDYVSCDVTAGNDINGSTDISAWLISPVLPMRNGDSLIFYTRATNDNNYSVYLKDRMQVRANFSNGSSDVGNSATSVGEFSRVLLDINSSYIYNDPMGNGGAAGYPRTWTRYKIVFSGIAGDSISAGRFAFRYLATDAGVFGGSSGNFPSIVGIDSLAFGRK